MNFQLEEGRVYSAKRALGAGTFRQLYHNDRQILRMSETHVLCTGPALPNAATLPREQFAEWAAADVTAQMPADGSWRKWDQL
jgi:hypothetical protein